jgi:DNA-binding transcriptional ArsR family regulator
MVDDAAARPDKEPMTGPAPAFAAHPHATGQSTLDAIFAALADPTRRAILTMLLEDDMAVTDVAEPFDMSLAAISKHLGVLADAGLITQEKRGRVKWCKLDPDAMRAASIWIQGFGLFEPVDYDALERLLERELGDGAS